MILVVNADDFGLSPGTNRAIVDAHQTGIVTSTSLLANGYAFAHAVELAHQTPSLGVGVHLTLTEGPPILPHNQLPLAPDGTLPLSNQPLVRAFLTGRLSRQVINDEFAAQVEKVIAAGIRPTHLDSHKYIHLLPGITPLVADIARQFSIPVIRVPRHIVDPVTRGRLKRWPGMLLLMGMSLLAARATRQVKTVDQFVGFVDTGHLTQDRIRRLLQHPRPGVTELICHPAYPSPELDQLGYAWIPTYGFVEETAAVSDSALRRELETAGWQFRRFDELDS